jgi:hypothetical protein
MRYDRLSRRFFLQGLGSSLAIPFLPSLIPSKAYAAGPDPIRYIQFLSSFGQYGSKFYPSDTGLAATASGIFARPLSGISGDISAVIGAGFTPYKNKVSVLRGMLVLAGSNLHNGSFPTCASGTPEDNEANGRPVYPYSIDQILSDSSKIYPDPTGKQKLVNICPSPQSYRNFSWNKKNGSVEHNANTTATSALLAKFSQLTQGTTPTATQSAKDKRQLNVVQGVYEDYKKVRDSRSISSTDRQRLESYMSLVDQIQKGLSAIPLQTACQNPPQEDDSTEVGTHHNHLNILAAAMACGLNRVTSYTLSVPYDPMHTWAHDNFPSEHANAHSMKGEYIAYFMKQLDQINETSGTLLDNSLIFWGNEFGEVEGDAHSTKMTALIAGGAGGSLQLGQYIDYRKTGSIPMNNLLVTFANCMGLSSADYEKDGVQGIGEYNTDTASAKNLTKYMITTERRKPLPYLYKGPTLG